jgi:hypothetical protein
LTPPVDLVSGSARPQDPVALGRDGVLARPGASPDPDQDDRVTRSTQRSPRVSLLAGILVATALGVACSESGPTPSPAAASSQPSPAASPAASPPPAELTPVPGGMTASPDQPRGTATQTDTPWGRIWDALPDSFPRAGASSPVDATQGPASAAFSVPAGLAEVTAAMKSALDAAGYNTDQSGPLEDGSFVLDSIGSTAGCRVKTMLAPQSGSTLMTILFGAGCPFE